jgi:hypothetical protein
LLERRGVENAGVVDEDVERLAGEAVVERSEQHVQVAFFAERCPNRERLPSRRFDRRQRLVRGVVIGAVVHRDKGAVGCKPRGDGSPDASRRAGH